jgi:hypothetical protein
MIISPRTEKVSKELSGAVYGRGGKIFEFNPSTGQMIERTLIEETNKVLR